MGVILVSTFASNALLSYGLGACDAARGGRHGSIRTGIALLASTFVAGILLWIISSLVLKPLGLRGFEILALALVVVPVMRYISSFLAQKVGTAGEGLFMRVDEVSLSCVVFGIALIVTRQGFGPVEVILASLSSVAGYSAATGLLGAINARLELSDIPAPLKGGPGILISAALISMAFSVLDVDFIARMVG
ncbi:MAG: hypothetical protein ACOYM2_14375 [Rectinemataceae bacterium]